jgi:hypothetical protein
MDTEVSKVLETFLTALNMNFQLVAPHIHRQNAAERAIQTFKNPFLAGICLTYKQLSLHLWDMLIPHGVLTLSLLRQWRFDTNA